jgi:Tfp pilus assembly protein PilP
VLDGFDEPTAIVENAAGRGFTVKRGAKIGPNGGVIIEILKDRLVIEETVTDFTGASKTTRTELTIRTQDQENEGDIR